MAEKNVSLINLELPDSIDTVVKNISEKPSSTIGETISDCLFLVFGGINQKAELKRAQYAFDLDVFKKDLESKLNAIPEEKRLNPSIQTVCTALDNMMFCVEEKELREMFASLIANSVDSSKISYVHPSYAEIIKQMTSFDAVVFNEIMQQHTLPTIRIRIKVNNGGMLVASRTLIWNDWGNGELVATSLDNLSRLKLINIIFDAFYVDDSIYDRLKNQQHVAEKIDFVNSQLGVGDTIEYEYGYIDITDYGKNFYKACSSTE